MDKIALVIVCDDGYLDNYYGIVCLKSFLYHNKWFNGDIIFFDDGKYFTISRKNRKLLKSLYHKVIIKKISYKKYKDLIDFFGNNENQKLSKNKSYIKAYPKFEVFDLKEYDKILCIDGDILFKDNIKELFNKNISLGVTSSIKYNFDNVEFNSIQDINYFKRNNYIYNDSGGFNSGVLYFGNNKLLSKNITNEIIEFSKKIDIEINPVLFFDQCILNYFFDKNYNEYITFISPIYNTEIATYNSYDVKYDLSSNCSNQYLKDLLEHSKIWHFLEKPLKLKPKNYFRRIWEYYKDM